MDSFLSLFRTLASFDPARRDLSAAPWEPFVDWAIAQGLGPLAAYNLEYRLTGAGAPEWARDRLLSIYQGTLNDNVMRLVNFKRALDGLEGRKVVLLDGASFAESLYPHIAFRPVPYLRLLVRPEDLGPLVGFLGESEYRPAPELKDPAGADRALTDDRTQLFLHGGLLDPGLLERAEAMPVFGPSAYRLGLEDAVLALCHEQAARGYEVEALGFIDLRELLLGSPSMAGAYSRPPDFTELLARAKALKVERALYASVSIVARLFPEAAQAAARATPEFGFATRTLLDTLLVAPAADLGKTRAVRGLDQVRRVLAGA
jgi:hypothetical protein